MNRQTYEALGRRARELVAPLVVDATFRHETDRRAFFHVYGGEPLWIECHAPAEVLVRRAAARAPDSCRARDADADIAARQVSEWEPLDTRHVTADADQEPDAILAALRDELDHRQRGKLRTGTRA
jgi:predicted kinase